MVNDYSSTIAIVYARYNSSRLPGKVLYQIGGSTIIGHCIKKLQQLNGLRIVVATSSEATDDPISEWAQEKSIDVERGDLFNVAMRTVKCLEARECDTFFRINADSPFLQTELLQQAFRSFYEHKDVDLVSNIVNRTYPYGIAVELVNAGSFLRSVKNFDNAETEHITTHFYKRIQDYRVISLTNQEDLSQERFVIDTGEDWADMQQLYSFDRNIFEYNISDLVLIKRKIRELRNI